MAKRLKAILAFSGVATLLTSAPLIAHSHLVNDIDKDQIVPSIIFLLFMVAFVAIPVGLLWPLVLKLVGRANVPRPRLDLLAGAIVGLLATLLYGSDLSGLFARAAFMVGFAVAAWSYWQAYERDRVIAPTAVDHPSQ